MPAVPQGGVCKLCHSSAHMGSQECGPCSSAALLDPPEVLPITMVERSGMLHDHLRRYKDDQSPSVSRRFARRLGALTAVFLRYHTACLGSWDVVTPIPSPDRSAPGSIIEWVGALKERRIDLLVGTEKVQHGSPEPASFTVAPEAEGKRVLLFDDMFTSEPRSVRLGPLLLVLWSSAATSTPGGSRQRSCSVGSRTSCGTKPSVADVRAFFLRTRP